MNSIFLAFLFITLFSTSTLVDGSKSSSEHSSKKRGKGCAADCICNKLLRLKRPDIYEQVTQQEKQQLLVTRRANSTGANECPSDEARANTSVPKRLKVDTLLSSSPAAQTTQNAENELDGKDSSIQKSVIRGSVGASRTEPNNTEKHEESQHHNVVPKTFHLYFVDSDFPKIQKCMEKAEKFYKAEDFKKVSMFHPYINLKSNSRNIPLSQIDHLMVPASEIHVTAPRFTIRLKRSPRQALSNDQARTRSKSAYAFLTGSAYASLVENRSEARWRLREDSHLVEHLRVSTFFQDFADIKEETDMPQPAIGDPVIHVETHDGLSDKDLDQDDGVYELDLNTATAKQVQGPMWVVTIEIDQTQTPLWNTNANEPAHVTVGFHSCPRQAGQHAARIRATQNKEYNSRNVRDFQLLQTAMRQQDSENFGDSENVEDPKNPRWWLPDAIGDANFPESRRDSLPHKYMRVSVSIRDGSRLLSGKASKSKGHKITTADDMMKKYADELQTLVRETFLRPVADGYRYGESGIDIRFLAIQFGEESSAIRVVYNPRGLFRDFLVETKLDGVDSADVADAVPILRQYAVERNACYSKDSINSSS